MKNGKQRKPSSGFTLVELLTVIAIIGILAVLIIPAVGKARELAQREKARSNIHQIALAYLTYSNEANRVRTMPTSGQNAVRNIYDWGKRLATDVDLNDASLYYIDVDPFVASAGLPKVIVRKNRNSGAITEESTWYGSPVGYEAAAGLSPQSPATTTPLIWTRGLSANGSWSGQTSPWEGSGGHIGYLDGHVEFYKNLNGEDGEGALLDYTTQEATKNIRNAISPSATIVKPIIGGTGGD